MIQNEIKINLGGLENENVEKNISDSNNSLIDNSNLSTLVHDLDTKKQSENLSSKLEPEEIVTDVLKKGVKVNIEVIYLNNLVGINLL